MELKKTIIGLSILTLLLLSGCSTNKTPEICTKIKYSDVPKSLNNTKLENGICIFNPNTGNNTLSIDIEKRLEYVSIIIVNTNKTCQHIDNDIREYCNILN